MYVCSLFESFTDIGPDQKSIISTALLYNYRKYNIKSLNETSRKSALSNEIQIGSQSSNENAMQYRIHIYRMSGDYIK